MPGNKHPSAVLSANNCAHLSEVGFLQQETIQKLRIVNPGPIPASFSMSMETRDTPFKVNPLTAELNPNEELELEVMPTFCFC